MSVEVTVLMSVYNGERFLREAMDSVLQQTFSNWEFLIVDDGSTDETWKILSNYAENDQRIVLHRNENNLGLAKSLNMGIQAAKGGYIARFDSDDMCLPARLERQVEALNSSPGIAVVGAWMQDIDEKGERLNVRRGAWESYAHYFFALLRLQTYLYHPSVMFRKTVIQKLGGYDESLVVGQDLDLWVRLAQAGYDARIIQEPLMYYRVHDEQLTTAKRETGLQIKSSIHERMLKSYLDEDAVEPVRLFLTQDDESWNWTSFARTRALVKALKKMARNIQERTGMKHDDYIELRRQFGHLAYINALAMIASSHRWASIPLLGLISEEAPVRSLKNTASYVFAFSGLSALVQRMKGRPSGSAK